MVRHLVIKAHPSSLGFTHKIASRFVSAAHDKGDEAELIDLYNEKYYLDNLKFENKKNFPMGDVVLDLQDKIRLADNIVFVCPMWWYAMPAVVKNFLDRVFTSGFAFKYTGKSMPDKLLKGKSAQVFMTCDGPSWFYFFMNPGKTIFKMTFMLCGVKLKDYVLFSQKFKADDSKLESWLSKVAKKV